MLYTTGFRSKSAFQGFAAAVVTKPGSVVLVYPHLEEQAVAKVPSLVTRRPFTDGEGPAAVVAAVLAEIGLSSTARLAVEESSLTLGLARALGQATLVAGGHLLARLRLTKDENELRQAREASERVSEVLERAFTRPIAGREELELQTELELELRRADSVGWSVTVLSGASSAIPRARAAARRIGPGDVLLVDVAASFGGIWGDVTRCGVIGEPSPRVQEVWDKLEVAQAAGIAAARVGKPVGGIDRAARDSLEDAGLARFFVHRTGHGLGLDVIEPPAVSADNDMLLEAGMTLTVEPGVYIPGEFGLRLEDSVAITEDGPEVLTPISRELRRLF